MDEFTNQIKRAAEPGVDLIIIGNANLDSNKWNDPKFIHANIANDLFQVIDQYGIKIEEVYCSVAMPQHVPLSLPIPF